MVDKKILGFDMDGVIVDNTSVKMKVLAKLGLKVKLIDTPAEIIRKIIPPELLDNMIFELYERLDNRLQVPLMPEALHILHQLQEVGSPYFLISRNSSPKSAVELLKVRGLWPKYFNEQNAFFVITPEDKNIKAKELGVTHYVDDETKVLSVLHDVPNKFLFDHLQVFPEHSSYTKVASHSELAKYFT